MKKNNAVGIDSKAGTTGKTGVEGAQEGDRGQVVPEQIETMEIKDGSIEDTVTSEALLNVVDQLEGSDIKVPRLKGGKGKASTKHDNGGDHAAHLVVITPEEPKTAAERVEQERFVYLDGQLTEWVSKTLENCAALDEIYNHSLWKWGGYKNYAHYTAVKFRYAQSTAHQYKKAGRVYKVLKDSTTVESSTLPTSERQLRPLLNIKDNSEIVEVWKKANELYSQTGKGVSEKAVASAKRIVLHERQDNLPAITADQLADQFGEQFRPKWNRCVEGQRLKLLGNLLVVLKAFYDELNMDERSPRLTTIFNIINKDEPEVPVKDTVKVQPVAQPEADKGKPAKPLRGRAFWDQLNWELPNDDLAETWRKAEQTIRNMRCQLRYGPAVKCETEQYQTKLTKERAKAKASRAKASGEQEMS